MDLSVQLGPTPGLNNPTIAIVLGIRAMTMGALSSITINTGFSQINNIARYLKARLLRVFFFLLLILQKVWNAYHRFPFICAHSIYRVARLLRVP